MDGELRVLQARDPRTGEPFATLLNFSAHSTTLGAQPFASGDWPQAANPMLEAAFGGRAVTVVGTLGRTQPARAESCAGDDRTDPAVDQCKIDAYAARVVDRARQAMAGARELRGRAIVESRSYLVTDPATNAFLLGILYAPGQAGFPLNRSVTPPWMAGNVIGTTTASMRIGDVLLSAVPGEMYPQIALKVREEMPGLRGWMTAGLANDQLGYLIAPLEAFPEPVKRTAVNDDPSGPADTIRPVANDNYAFAVSHTMGERVTCSLLRGAGAVFGRGAAPRRAYPRCAAFANDAAAPAGSDVAADAALPQPKTP